MAKTCHKSALVGRSACTDTVNGGVIYIINN
jgi:hypothetical protein